MLVVGRQAFDGIARQQLLALQARQSDADRDPSPAAATP
jgi:hypothetical protein